MELTKIALKTRTELPPRSGKFLQTILVGGSVTAVVLDDHSVYVDGLGDGNRYVFPAGSIAYLVMEPTFPTSTTHSPTTAAAEIAKSVSDDDFVVDVGDDVTVVTTMPKGKRGKNK
jgi:hypothetical protein